MLHDGKVLSTMLLIEEKMDHVILPPERRDKSNILHDKLEGKIYMENPKGYTDSLLTCKMRNPLYGYMKGSKSWHPKLNSSILSKRFERCKIGYESNNILLLFVIRLEEGG